MHAINVELFAVCSLNTAKGIMCRQQAQSLKSDAEMRQLLGSFARVRYIATAEYALTWLHVFLILDDGHIRPWMGYGRVLEG